MTETSEVPEERSNWRRWGDDDQRGALNLLTPPVVLGATHSCREGKVYSLGLPIQQTGMPTISYRNPPLRLTLLGNQGQSAVGGGDDTLVINEDVLVVATHNGTHIDALSHVAHGAHMYNGYPAGSFETRSGATKCGIETMGGFAGRAVVADVFRHRGASLDDDLVSAEEVLSVLDSAGLTLGSGDILLVRTGWIDRFINDPANTPIFRQPGLAPDVADLVLDNGVAAVGCDNSAVDPIPSALDLHIELLVRQGVPLLEHLDLRAAAADGVATGLLVVAPLPIVGATGSPVNPILIS